MSRCVHPARCLILGFVFLGPTLAGTASAQDIPSFAREIPQVRSGPPVLAFNGKDLSGFYTYLHDHKYDDPDKVFSVVDGVLVISGKEWGGVTSKDEFADYHLIAEWKWGGRAWPPRLKNARDSGILLHCVGPDGAAAGHWMESQECQIIEGGCGDLLMVGGLNKPRLTCEVRIGPDNQPYYEKGGKSVTKDSGRYNWWGRDPAWKDVLGIRGGRDVEKPAGEWNRIEAICEGDTITILVNGYLVNVGTKSSLTRGKITFQSEGAEIHIRKIEVRPLIK